MFESLMNKIAFLGHWGYLLIFIAAFLESSAFMGFLVPGESIVVLAGFLSSHALLDIGDFLWVITLGAILGDSVGYSLGRVFGKDYFEKHDRLLFLKNKHIKSPKGIFRNTAERPFFLAGL
jgi:membrane protein DedA with SNARE-associated domain